MFRAFVVVVVVAQAKDPRREADKAKERGELARGRRAGLFARS